MYGKILKVYPRGLCPNPDPRSVLGMLNKPALKIIFAVLTAGTETTIYATTKVSTTTKTTDNKA